MKKIQRQKWLLALPLMLVAFVLPQGAWAGACQYSPACFSSEDMKIHYQSKTSNSNGSSNDVQGALKFNFKFDIFNYDGDPNGYWEKNITLFLDNDSVTFYSDYSCTQKKGTKFNDFWAVFGNGDEKNGPIKHNGGSDADISGVHAWFQNSSGIKGYIKFYHRDCQTGGGNKSTRISTAVYIYDLYGHKVTIKGTWSAPYAVHTWNFYLGGCPRAKDVSVGGRSNSQKDATVSWKKETYGGLPAKVDSGAVFKVLDNGTWKVSRGDSYDQVASVSRSTTSVTDTGAGCSSSGTPTYKYYVCYEPVSTYGTSTGTIPATETRKRGLEGISAPYTFDHFWTAWETQTAATDSQSGTKQRSCPHCKTEQTNVPDTYDEKSSWDFKCATGHEGLGTIKVTGGVTSNEITVTVTPKEGYHLKYWNDATTNTNTTRTFTLTGGLREGSLFFEAHSYGNDALCTASHCKEPQTPTLEASYYEISKPGHLLWFAKYGEELQNKEIAAKREAPNYRLKNNINMNGYEYISPFYATTLDNLSYNKSTISQPGFKGYFDGQGYVISNLTVPAANGRYSAGIVGNNSGTIQNVVLDAFTYDNGGSFDGRYGAICGVNFGKVGWCGVAYSTVKSAGHIVGAITGANYGGTVTHCFAMGCTLDAATRIGYLVGDNRNDNSTLKGEIENCYADGKNLQGTYTGMSCTGQAGLSSTDFKSGKVTCLLSNWATSGTTWRQNIDKGTKSSYPVPGIDQNIVYWAYKDCASTTRDKFSNYKQSHTTEGHSMGSLVGAVTETCEAAGNHAYYLCSFCNTKYKDNGTHTTDSYTDGGEVIAKAGHGSTKWTTESQRGYTETITWDAHDDLASTTCHFTLTCNKCSKKMKDNVSLTVAEKDRVAPKCEQQGSVTYYVTTPGYNVTGDAAYTSVTDNKPLTFLALTHNYVNGFCHVTSGEEHLLPAGGKGTKEEPYTIGTAGQLYWFSNQASQKETKAYALASYVSLVDDITINSKVLNSDYTLVSSSSSLRKWNPIGEYTADCFSGTFAGNGHSISGLYFYSTSNLENLYPSLFSYTKGGTISGVDVKDSYINGWSSVGGIVSYAENTDIKSCSFDGVLSSKSATGGIAGRGTAKTRITHCRTSGVFTVTAATGYQNGVGGIGGSLTADTNTDNVSVWSCYSTATLVTNRNDNIACVAGYMKNVNVNKFYSTQNSNLLPSSNSSGVTTLNAENNVNESRFHSGEIAWLLNDKSFDNAEWRQDLSNSGSYPVVTSAEPLVRYACGQYTNDKISIPLSKVGNYYYTSFACDQFFEAAEANTEYFIPQVKGEGIIEMKKYHTDSPDTLQYYTWTPFILRSTQPTAEIHIVSSRKDVGTRPVNPGHDDDNGNYKSCLKAVYQADGVQLNDNQRAFAAKGGIPGFYKYSNKTIPKFKAYLDLEELGISSSKTSFICIFEEDDDSVTAVELTPEGGMTAPEAIYSADGIKRNKVEKGINILKLSDGSTKTIYVK